MSFFRSMESLGVQLAFAEANVWDASLIENCKNKEKLVTTTLRKKRARSAAVVYGILSVALYAVTFTNADTVMAYATKGHFFAAVPIATVFLFSWIHGKFTGNIWTALGIEGSTKKFTSVQKETTAQKRQDTRPRATVQA